MGNIPHKRGFRAPFSCLGRVTVCYDCYTQLGFTPYAPGAPGVPYPPMNTHTPERGADESPADYKARRHASRKAAAALERGPSQDPLPPGLSASQGLGDASGSGQHTNPSKVMRRALLDALGARQLRHQAPRYAEARARRAARG